ncbi:hypothetical protein HDG33_005191 [Paraburkholderia sp. Cpub6]|nr:hypothetical protein [Paraburkholderia sp. Cpub6]
MSYLGKAESSQSQHFPNRPNEIYKSCQMNPTLDLMIELNRLRILCTLAHIMRAP